MKTLPELAAHLELVAAQIKTEPMRYNQIMKCATVSWLAAEMQREAERLARISDSDRMARNETLGRFAK